jgi:simple sugar transport system permease protein
VAQPEVVAEEQLAAVDSAGVALDQVPVEQLAADATVVTPPSSRWTQALRSITTGSIGISVLAIFLALVAGGILIAVTNQQVITASGYFFADPAATFSAIGNAVGGAYGALFNAAVFNTNAGDFSSGISSLLNTLSVSTSFIIAGLGIALGFRVGMFNIGGQGQMLIAAACAGLIAFKVPFSDSFAIAHIALAVLAGLVGGAVWAGIAGALKAINGAHEVIVTIMLNYIALYLINYLLTTPVMQAKGSSNPITPSIPASAKYPALFGTANGVDVGFILAIAATVAIWWLLERSSLGFKFRAVGENPRAARVAGMNVKSVYIWAMVISGALVGLAAVSQVLGTTLFGGFGNSIDNGIGFTAITVALLGRSRPLGVFIAGILFGALQNGGPTMQAAVNVPVDVVTVIQSVVVLFIAAPPLVRAIFRLPTPGVERKPRRRSKEVAA